MEWKNWKTLYKDNIKLDSHHAEVIDIETGEVLKDTSIYSAYDEFINGEVENHNKLRNYHKGRVIHRGDVGDCFCTTDWSKH